MWTRIVTFLSLARPGPGPPGSGSPGFLGRRVAAFRRKEEIGRGRGSRGRRPPFDQAEDNRQGKWRDGRRAGASRTRRLLRLHPWNQRPRGRSPFPGRRRFRLEPARDRAPAYQGKTRSSSAGEGKSPPARGPGGQGSPGGCRRSAHRGPGPVGRTIPSGSHGPMPNGLQSPVEHHLSPGGGGVRFVLPASVDVGESRLPEPFIAPRTRPDPAQAERRKRRLGVVGRQVRHELAPAVGAGARAAGATTVWREAAHSSGAWSGWPASSLIAQPGRVAAQAGR